MTREQLEALIKDGKSAADVAVIIGVSRQRVYQIAAKLGVKFPRQMASFRAPPRPPKPRLMTGGVAAQVSHSVAGKVAELLAAADLLARGWQVFLPLYANDTHDVVAIKGEIILTFEVRSAHRNQSGRLIFSKKAGCKSDHYALVVTGEPVSYDPQLE